MGDGQGVIDASVENTFSAQINGRAAVTAYQVGIFKNNATSDLVYDSGIVELEVPFYGADSRGDVVRFEYAVPSNDSEQESYTEIENGYIYGYKYILTVWWDLDASDYSSGCVDSYETVFYAYSTPTIAIDSFTSVMSGTLPVVEAKACTWHATYTQANVIPVQWFQWTLALASDHNSVVEQTNRIYSNSAVAYTHDGLISGTNYAIKVDAQTKTGVLITSGWTDFAVAYSAGILKSVVEISVTGDNGIKLDWGKLKYIEGVPNNQDYQYLTPVPNEGHTAVELLDGNTITFASSTHFALEIPLEAEHVWSGYIDDDNADIYYASGTDDNDAAFYIQLSHAGSSPGLWPSTTLYPSVTLYPIADNGGYFLLDVNATSSHQVSTEHYYPSLYWFVIKMGINGMSVYATPIELSVISDATVIAP